METQYFEDLTEYTASCSSDEKQTAEFVFTKMDLNRDGKLDWQEMSAVFTTYDAGGEVGSKTNGDINLDGKLKKDEYTDVADKLTQLDNSFTKTVQNWYTRLFNPKK